MVDVEDLREGAKRKNTNTLRLLLLLYNRIAEENADDLRVEKVHTQIEIIEEELKRRRDGGEVVSETASETVYEDEDGKRNITVGLKPLSLQVKAKLK
jgi:hypothetical protein